MKTPRPHSSAPIYAVLLALACAPCAQAAKLEASVLPVTEPIATLLGLVGLYVLVLRRKDS